MYGMNKRWHRIFALFSSGFTSKPHRVHLSEGRKRNCWGSLICFPIPIREFKGSVPHSLGVWLYRLKVLSFLSSPIYPSLPRGKSVAHHLQSLRSLCPDHARSSVLYSKVERSAAVLIVLETGVQAMVKKYIYIFEMTPRIKNKCLSNPADTKPQTSHSSRHTSRHSLRHRSRFPPLPFIPPPSQL